MKTIIIGGGVAGLTAGIYGQLSGLDCLIVEKNDFVGGNLTGWNRNGFYIDNCMHWLNGTKEGNGLNSMWRTVGMLSDNVKINKIPAFYTVEKNGKSLSLWQDLDRTEKEMYSVSPIDREETERFIRSVRLLSDARKKGIEGKLAVLRSISKMVKYNKMSLGELANRFKNPLIKCLITDYLTPELSALSLIFAYSDFVNENAYVPYGGSRNAAERMKRRYLALGGKLLTSVEADKIIFEGKKAVGVRLKDGRTVRSDRIIACCDPKVTFGRLLSEGYMPKALAKAYKDGINMPKFSCVQAAFSCDFTNEIPKNPIIFEIKNLKIEGRDIGRMLVKPYTSFDLDMPKGKAVLQVMFYLYDSEAERWIGAYKNKEAYEDLKMKFAEAVKKRIIAQFPSTKRSLKVLDVWTPASYNRYFNSNNGAFLSFAMKPGRAVLFHVPSKVKGLDNVFIATQWQRSPGGLPVAASAGKRAVKEALRIRYASENKFKIKKVIEKYA